MQGYIVLYIAAGLYNMLLQEKFKDSPLKIGEVIDKLLSLDTPGITRKEVGHFQPCLYACMVINVLYRSKQHCSP